jgi:hypothetical protein
MRRKNLIAFVPFWGNIICDPQLLVSKFHIWGLQFPFICFIQGVVLAPYITKGCAMSLSSSALMYVFYVHVGKLHFKLSSFFLYSVVLYIIK